MTKKEKVFAYLGLCAAGLCTIGIGVLGGYFGQEQSFAYHAGMIMAIAFGLGVLILGIRNLVRITFGADKGDKS